MTGRAVGQHQSREAYLGWVEGNSYTEERLDTPITAMHACEEAMEFPIVQHAGHLVDIFFDRHIAVEGDRESGKSEGVANVVFSMVGQRKAG
jgi:hypothetical protein